jgi:hypothetical protein
LMQSEGLSAAEVLRASTVEAADAMRETGEFGKIAKGYRADLVLLDQNPLADVAALDRNEGVLVHGHWLDRPSLDEALARLASIYADGRPVPQLSEAPVKALIGRVAKAQADGFVFDDTTFVRLADALRKAGHPALAKSVEALEVAIPASACYVPAPTD